MTTKLFLRVSRKPSFCLYLSLAFCISLVFTIQFYLVTVKTEQHIEYQHVNYPKTLPVADLNPSKMVMVGSSRRHVSRNSSCVLVGCHSRGTVGTSFFWDYYSKQGVSLSLTEFDYVQIGNDRIHPTWCRIPSVTHELIRNPTARVVYIDIDTLCDVQSWCNMEHLGDAAPIIMTSLHRSKPEATSQFIVHGTRVQANLFVVAPGPPGRMAMMKWEKTYGNHPLRDQGSIHKHEGSLCGVPGWIHCHSNPHQQKCHCAGRFKGNTSDKRECIRKLFQGELSGCSISQPD